LRSHRARRPCSGPMRESRGGPQLNAMQGCAAFEGNSRGALVKLTSAPLSYPERLQSCKVQGSGPSNLIVSCWRPLSLHPVIDAAAKKPTYKEDNQKIDQLHRSPTHGAGWSDVHVAFSFAQHKQCGPRQAHNQEQTPTCHPTGPNQSAILLRHSASLCLLRPVRNVVVSGRSGTAAKLGRADVWRRS